MIRPSGIDAGNAPGYLIRLSSGRLALAWTRPQVVARQPGGWLSCPYLFERRPGENWLTTHYAGVRTGGKREIIAGARLRLMESDFAGE